MTLLLDDATIDAIADRVIAKQRRQSDTPLILTTEQARVRYGFPSKWAFYRGAKSKRFRPMSPNRWSSLRGDIVFGVGRRSS